MVLTCLLKGKFWGFVFWFFFFFWIMHWHELLEFWSLSIVSPHNNPWDLVCMFLNSMLMHRISQKVLASEMQKAALGFSSQVPMMAVVSLFFSFVEVIFLFPFIECACLPSEMNVHCVHESPGEAKHFRAISWLDLILITWKRYRGFPIVFGWSWSMRSQTPGLSLSSAL